MTIGWLAKRYAKKHSDLKGGVKRTDFKCGSTAYEPAQVLSLYGIVCFAGFASGCTGSLLERVMPPPLPSMEIHPCLLMPVLGLP